jgi:hypothetical protein
VFALVALGGAALYPALAADRVTGIVAALGGLAVLLLALAVTGRWPAMAAWAVAVGGAEYAVFLATREPIVDRWAPLVAGALFVAAELGFRAVEPSAPAVERAAVLRSILWLATGFAGTAAFGAVILAAAGGARAGIGLEVLGAAAAVAALALVVGVVARASDSS